MCHLSCKLFWVGFILEENQFGTQKNADSADLLIWSLMDKKTTYNATLYKHSDLTEQVIGAFYAVYSALGYGFLENVYVKALMIELKRRGMKVDDEFQISVYYLGQQIGEYYADLIVNELVILEIKAVKHLIDEHEAQLLNYLKATPYEVGL